MTGLVPAISLRVASWPPDRDHRDSRFARPGDDKNKTAGTLPGHPAPSSPANVVDPVFAVVPADPQRRWILGPPLSRRTTVRVLPRRLPRRAGVRRGEIVDRRLHAALLVRDAGRGQRHLG